MSLKSELYSLIKSRNGKALSYEEFETICKRDGQRTETGTRRMRELTHCEHPEIDILTSKKGAIIGWFWKRPSYASQGKMF